MDSFICKLFIVKENVLEKPYDFYLSSEGTINRNVVFFRTFQDFALL